jgi:guanylate kinase
MICLIGDSCAGKTSIERELCKNGYNRVISYTTRSIRNSEKQNIDYHFISEKQFEEMFNNHQLAEWSLYNSWHYCIAKEDCVDNALAVVNPNGYRQLRKNKNLNIVSFYIKVPERERVIRMMKRGDNVMESFRRIISDQGSFNGIENEVDFVVNNDRPLEETIQEILSILKEKQKIINE